MRISPWKKPIVIWIEIIAIFFVFFPLVARSQVLDPTEALVLDEIRSIFPILTTAPVPWIGDSLNGCTWSYVTCEDNGTFLHVVQLELNGVTSSVPGYLPSTIGDLTHVTYLAMYLWALEGHRAFPDSIQYMKNLTGLGFAQGVPATTNELLPSWMGSLPLVTIGVQNVNFSGSNFSVLGNIPTLESINMIGSYIDGPFPDIRGATKLRSIDWGLMKITGSIPSWIDQLTQLAHLGLDDNQLNGTIPQEMGDLQYLDYLSLGKNLLTGPLPSSFSQLLNLHILSIHDNQLSGTLPNLSALPNLEHLRLDSNNFTGDLSQFLGGRPPSQSCNVNYNAADFICSPNITICCGSYQGNRYELDPPQTQVLKDILNIFPELSNFSVHGSGAWVGDASTRGCSWTGVTCSKSPRNITRLKLGLSNAGYLPVSIGNLSELESIEFTMPTITQPIPSTLQNCKKLSSIGLSQGNLPSPTSQPWLDWLVTLPLLLDLQIQNINFTGSDFSSIGTMTKLHSVNLVNNGISGELLDLRNMSELIGLLMPFNGITGPLPSWIGQLAKLEIIFLNDNAITAVPSEISQLRYLRELRMANNSLGGSFPTITNLPLQILDLSSNKLSGNIPDMTNMLKLKELYIFNNDLTGDVNEALGPAASGITSCNVNNNNEDLACSDLDVCCSGYIAGRCSGFACGCSTDLTSLTKAYVPCTNGNWQLSGDISTKSGSAVVIGLQDTVTVDQLTLDPQGTVEIHYNTTGGKGGLLNIQNVVHLAGKLEIVISSSQVKNGQSVKIINGKREGSFGTIKAVIPREMKEKCKKIGVSTQGDGTGFSVVFTTSNPCAENNKAIIGAVVGVGAAIIITIVIIAIVIIVRYRRQKAAKKRGIPIDRILGNGRPQPERIHQTPQFDSHRARDEPEDNSASEMTDSSYN